MQLGFSLVPPDWIRPGFKLGAKFSPVRMWCHEASFGESHDICQASALSITSLSATISMHNHCISAVCPTCHPCLGMFGKLWFGVYDVFLFLSIFSNFTQPLKWSGPSHKPQSATWSMTFYYVKEMRQMVVTPNTDLTHKAQLHISEWTFMVASLRRLCNIHAIKSASC